MKRLFWISLFVANICLGASGKTFSEVQLLTRAAPTSATTGMDTSYLKGWRVSVCAPTGATLSGAGTVDVYNRNAATGLWEFNKGLQMTISVGATSCSGSPCQCQVFPDFVQYASLGSQVLPAANAVTTSSGTTVTVYVVGWLVPQ